VDIATKKVPRKKLFSFVESATDMCGNSNEKPWQIWSYVVVSPPPSRGESSNEESSSSEQSQTSNNSQTSAQMANQNNPTRPWLDQDVVVVPGPQHPLPKHPEKWLPKFDPILNSQLRII
jgi:hypothetical protein